MKSSVKVKVPANKKLNFNKGLKYTITDSSVELVYNPKVASVQLPKDIYQIKRTVDKNLTESEKQSILQSMVYSLYENVLADIDKLTQLKQTLKTNKKAKVVSTPSTSSLSDSRADADQPNYIEGNFLYRGNNTAKQSIPDSTNTKKVSYNVDNSSLTPYDIFTLKRVEKLGFESISNENLDLIYNTIGYMFNIGKQELCEGEVTIYILEYKITGKCVVCTSRHALKRIAISVYLAEQGRLDIETDLRIMYMLDELGAPTGAWQENIPLYRSKEVLSAKDIQTATERLKITKSNFTAETIDSLQDLCGRYTVINRTYQDKDGKTEEYTVYHKHTSRAVHCDSYLTAMKLVAMVYLLENDKLSLASDTSLITKVDFLTDKDSRLSNK